jgi:hypothetical protein
MIRIMLVLLLIPASLHSQPFKSYTPPGRGVSIEFYKNIEFLGFVFFLGSQYMGELYENDETLNASGFKKKDWFAYDLALYKQYKPFKSNGNLKAATQFAEARDAADIIPLLVQLDEFPRATISDTMPAANYRAFSEKGDSAEARKNVSVFIQALNDFYREVSFDKYFSEADLLYEQTMKEIKSVLPSGRFLPAMEKFYRHRFNGYALVPSLTIPSGMAFGVSYSKNGKTFIVNVFGPFALQQFSMLPYNMGFADENHIRELSVHEFGHSFTNPVLNKIPGHLIKETAVLLDTVRTAMENQGYNNWMSCLYEHFVRAGEVIIAKNLKQYESAERLRREYINNRKFIYLPLIIEELERYNKNRKVSYEQVTERVMQKLKKLN